MPVDRDDSVGILVYDDSVRIHAEGPDIVLEELCAVDDLALIELIREMREDDGGKLHPDAEIHAV